MFFLRKWCTHIAILSDFTVCFFGIYLACLVLRVIGFSFGLSVQCGFLCFSLDDLLETGLHDGVCPICIKPKGHKLLGMGKMRGAGFCSQSSNLTLKGLETLLLCFLV